MGTERSVWMLRPPGVYRPQADTWLLARALYDAAIPFGAKVLDLCTGSGALAVAAVRAGAGHVMAVDISLLATLTARFNTLIRGLPVKVKYGDALALPAGQRFDVVLANPPYVPSEQRELIGRRAARAWNAARDGRALLDPLCTNAPDMLSPGGILLIVHSEVCGIKSTLDKLRHGGLKAAVVARRVVPFGPVMRQRIPLLERQGLIRPGQRHEELVVIRGDRPYS